MSLWMMTALNSTNVHPVDDDIPRFARVYRNAHTIDRRLSKCYHVSIGGWWGDDDYYRHDRVALYDVTEKEALEAAKLYVAKGIDPETGKKFKIGRRGF